MPYYEWRGSGVFRDASNNREIEPGDVVELSEKIAGNHDFVAVEAPEDEDSEGNPEGSDGGDGVPLAEKDYSELREMAVEADTDEINGRSSKDEIVAYFEE